MFSSDFSPGKLRRVLALLICCAPVGSPLFAENEIINPGFEQDAAAWNLQVAKQDEGKGIEMSVVAEAPRAGGTGEKCLKLSSPLETRYSAAPGTRLKGVEPGEHYRISAWIKPGDSFACKPGALGFYIRATLFTAPGKDAPGGHLFFLPGEKVIYGRLPAGSDAQPLPAGWSQVVALFEIPPETKLMALNFFVEGASGPLYLDDVALDKVAATIPLTPVTGKPSPTPAADASIH